MNDFNTELARLRSELARSEQLRARLNSLYPRREELAAQEAERRAERLEEQEDVDRLEGRSLARFIYSLTGSLEKRLDRERMGARAAAVKHDAAVRELADLEDDISETAAALKELEGIEQKYEDALAHMAELLKSAGSPAAQRLRELERQMAEAERTHREAAEAAQAGQYARQCALEALDSLQDAKALGTLDLFTDSLLVNLVKYGQMDESQIQMEELNVALRRFNTELADLSEGLSLDVGGFLGFADFFFDNFFVDFAINSRIHDSYTAVSDILRKIEDALAQLEELLARCESSEKQLDAEYEQLITATCSAPDESRYLI